jgi:membrane protein DedA with SNARE-associated domain
LFEEILTTYGYLGVFLVSLAVNLIPFTSPSNLVIAGAVAFLFPTMHPLSVGLTVAVAATIAKTAHYYVAAYVGTKTTSSTKKLESYGRSLGRWGALAVFVAAATPIPDDPLVIPLGLTRYSPAKFFVAYLLGKALVSVAGAYIGRQSALTFETIFPSNEYVIVSAVLSVLLASVLIKADMGGLVSRFKEAIRKSRR